MQKSTHSSEYRLLRTELRRIRQAAGLSQRDLSDRLKVPHSWVAKVESGERRIDLVEAYWFFLACGVSAQDSINRTVERFTKRSFVRASKGDSRT
jgi:transcriptional regulator with XRE-family HTH domain